ncbi:hypothetical protein C8Q75DRAFT_181082 [Abortiporus biennis]|nr:hypothetical protein C8Q75DRAFT_181082 [Abortiporus biennis]
MCEQKYKQRLLSPPCALLDVMMNDVNVLSHPPTDSTRMASVPMLDFPNELLVLIFFELPLKDLITGRGVCRLWRDLIPNPGLPGCRVRLLEFYLRIISTDVFLASRHLTFDYVESINRQRIVTEYFDDLGSMSEFKCYLLEWPTKATVGLLWPIVTREVAALHPFYGVQLPFQRKGANQYNLTIFSPGGS